VSKFVITPQSVAFADRILEQPPMIDTPGSVLRAERDGAVTILTLNRPEHLNSFDEALHQAFARFWIELDYDDSVRGGGADRGGAGLLRRRQDGRLRAVPHRAGCITSVG